MIELGLHAHKLKSFSLGIFYHKKLYNIHINSLYMIFLSVGSFIICIYNIMLYQQMQTEQNKNKEDKNNARDEYTRINA